MAIIITFGNFKGGTGKTTNSVMTSYLLGRKGYKTLLVDMDPQANATTALLKTKQRIEKEPFTFDKTLMTAVYEEDLSSIVTPIANELYLLPSYSDFTSYQQYLEDKFPKAADRGKRVYNIKKLLEKLEYHFDFIIFDVPPTFSVYTDNAIVASDYTVVVLQTEERSLEGAEDYISHLQKLIDLYDLNIDVIGILPVLMSKKSQVDQSVLNLAYEKFSEENIFKEKVTSLERLKRYDVIGIGDPLLTDGIDVHDHNVLKLYDKIATELVERLIERGHDIDKK